MSKESSLNNRSVIDGLMETQRLQLSDNRAKRASTPTKGSEISSFSGFNAQGTVQRDLVTENINNILSRLDNIRDACRNNNVTNLYNTGFVQKSNCQKV